MGKGRTPCCEKESVKKGPWSQHEDLKLISFIQRHGHSNWRSLPKLAGLARCGKSCRLRWVNYLRPEVKRGSLSPDEEETIIRLQSILGNKWSKIASHLPGRTDNEIKNIWNTHLKKRSTATKPSTTKSNDHDNEATLRCDDLHGNAGMSSYEEPSLVDLWNSLLLDEASGSQHDQVSDGIQIQSSSMETNEVVDERRSESNHQPQTSTNNDGTLKMDSNMKSYLEIMAWPSSPTDYSFPGY